MTSEETLKVKDDQYIDNLINTSKPVARGDNPLNLDSETLIKVKHRLSVACRIRADRTMNYCNDLTHHKDELEFIIGRIKTVINDFDQGFIEGGKGLFVECLQQAQLAHTKHCEHVSSGYSAFASLPTDGSGADDAPMEVEEGPTAVVVGSSSAGSSGNVRHFSGTIAADGTRIINPSDPTGHPTKNMSHPRVCDMADSEIEALTNEVNDVMNTLYSEISKRVNITVDSSDIINNVILSLRENRPLNGPDGATIPDEYNRRAHKTMSVLVNGDVQKGKTDVTLMYAMVCYTISLSGKCCDILPVILVTGQCQWAVSMVLNIYRKLDADKHARTFQRVESDHMYVQELDDDDDSDANQEAESVKAQELLDKFGEDVKCATMQSCSKKDNEKQIKSIFARGGILVIARVHTQIDRAITVKNQYCDDLMKDFSRRDALPWWCFLLDESDHVMVMKHVGDVSKTGGLDAYEKKMGALLGFSYTERNFDKARRNPPFLVVHVSATNAGVFIAYLNHIGKKHDDFTGEQSQNIINLLDVHSFKQQTIEEGYHSLDNRVAWNKTDGRNEEFVVPAKGRYSYDDYLTEQGTRILGSAYSSKKSTVLMSLTPTVNRSARANQADTQMNYNARMLVNRLLDPQTDAGMPDHYVASVMILGSSATYEGNSAVLVTSFLDPCGANFLAGLSTFSHRAYQEAGNLLDELTRRLNSDTAVTLEERSRFEPIRDALMYALTDLKDSAQHFLDLAEKADNHNELIQKPHDADIDNKIRFVVGSEWENIGTTMPARGKEVVRDELSRTLLSKTRFTSQELEDMGCGNLLCSNYVKVGESYFKPSAGGYDSSIPWNYAPLHSTVYYQKHLDGFMAEMKLDDAKPNPTDKDLKMRENKQRIVKSFEQALHKSRVGLEKAFKRWEKECHVSIEKLRPLITYMELKYMLDSPGYCMETKLDDKRKYTTANIKLLLLLMRRLSDMSKDWQDMPCVKASDLYECDDDDDDETTRGKYGFEDMTLGQLFGPWSTLDMPFVLNGKDMIRRCLSLVAVHNGEALLSITHSFINAGLDAASMLQLTGRSATTATAIALLFGALQCLWSANTHVCVDGHLAYNKMTIFNETQKTRHAVFFGKLNNIVANDSCFSEPIVLRTESQQQALDRVLDKTVDGVPKTDDRMKKIITVASAEFEFPPELVSLCAKQKDALFPKNKNFAGMQALAVKQDGVKRTLHAIQSGEDLDEVGQAFDKAWGKSSAFKAPKTKAELNAEDIDDKNNQKLALAHDSFEEAAIHAWIEYLTDYVKKNVCSGDKLPATEKGIGRLIYPKEEDKKKTLSHVPQMFDPVGEDFKRGDVTYKKVFFRIEHFPSCWAEFENKSFRSYMQQSGFQEPKDEKHWLKWCMLARARQLGVFTSRMDATNKSCKLLETIRPDIWNMQAQIKVFLDAIRPSRGTDAAGSEDPVAEGARPNRKARLSEAPRHSAPVSSGAGPSSASLPGQAYEDRPELDADMEQAVYQSYEAMQAQQIARADEDDPELHANLQQAIYQSNAMTQCRQMGIGD